KFAFQLFAALISVVLYSTLRDYVPRRIAFLATFLCISFPVFLTDITMLNRQETALLCFALALQTGLDKRLKPATKSVLTGIFLVGMVWAHYSTSYVAVAILVLAALMEIVWRAFEYRQRRRPSREAAPISSRLPAIISLPVTIGSLLILVAWGTVATQTSNNVTQTVGGVIALVTGARPPATPAASNQAVSATQYATATTDTRPAFVRDYYADGQTANNQIKNEQPIIAAPSPLLQKHGISSQLLGKFYDLVRSAYSLFIEIGIVIGLVWWYMTRRSAKLPRQYLLFGVAGLFVIAAQAVLPSTLINYGLTRVIQEALLVLALPIVLAWLWGMKLIRIPRRLREPLLAVILAVFFLILSGFVSALSGGYKPVLGLSNTGLYYQAYYTHEDEVSAAYWLGTQIPTGSHIVSDEFMRRKIIAYENIFAQTGIIPGAIPKDSYVVISHGDREFNEVPAYDRSEVIYYSVPYQFLDGHKDLVYSTGNIVIYK
ncbi:MAG TPA: glycosyltransferase family 39 protein, partial [Verrucomicrobiae bacterium]|nr:glycosyltransferase family 39 protein [Verrucomicrobiae bacterium]